MFVCTFFLPKLPFLDQRKGENDRRKYYIINFDEIMFPDPVGIEPAASRSRVGRESDCATESGSYLKIMTKQNDTFTITEYKQKLTASEEPH